MGKKDWIVPLITGAVGVAGALGGGVITGRYQENMAWQQTQVELIKISSANSSAEIKDIKDAATRYLAENDKFLNALVLCPKKKKLLIDSLTRVQTSGAELIVLADEELAVYTNSVNAISASLLLNENKATVAQRLEQLAIIRANWMKQLRRSLEIYKKQSERNLIVRFSRNLSLANE